MIYVVVGEVMYEVMYTEISNMLVTTDKEKAFSCKIDDFVACTKLWVEVWENEELIKDIRLV